MGSMSIMHWLIVLAVVILVFGTGKIRKLGEDVGGMFKSFREASGGESIKDAAVEAADAVRDVKQTASSVARKLRS